MDIFGWAVVIVMCLMVAVRYLDDGPNVENLKKEIEDLKQENGQLSKKINCFCEWLKVEIDYIGPEFIDERYQVNKKSSEQEGK